MQKHNRSNTQLCFTALNSCNRYLRVSISWSCEMWAAQHVALTTPCLGVLQTWSMNNGQNDGMIEGTRHCGDGWLNYSVLTREKRTPMTGSIIFLNWSPRFEHLGVKNSAKASELEQFWDETPLLFPLASHILPITSGHMPTSLMWRLLLSQPAVHAFKSCHQTIYCILRYLWCANAR